MTTVDPRDVLAQRAAMAPAPGIQPGTSGYFTPPTPTLDPNLFDANEKLRDDVRQWLMATCYNFLNRIFKGAHTWATIWIAGSGASYQWSAARDPRDLDVLVGVKPLAFKRHNPFAMGESDAAIASVVTDAFRQGLDPLTARQRIGTSSYEVTWYVNPGAADIRNINAYAAYDVTHNLWTVRPPKLSADWGVQQFPHDWWQQIHREKKHAQEIIGGFLQARAQYLSARDDAVRRNAEQRLEYYAAIGKQLFDDIHSERRNAFSPTGAGYRDYYNFRWQAHKMNGVVPALHQIADLVAQSKQAVETKLYGHPLASTDQAVQTAALLHSHLNALELR